MIRPDLIEELEARDPEQVSQWRKCLESVRVNFRFLHATGEELERLAKDCENPSQFTLILRWLYRDSRVRLEADRPVELLFFYADGSQYTLKEWLEAISVFSDWMDKEGRDVSFLEMLKYLKCCTELQDAKTTTEVFANLVHSALDVYDLKLERH